MGANTNPVFILTPKTATAEISAANTQRDGGGTLVTLYTAGSNGSLVSGVKFISAQASAAASSDMVVRVFLTDTSGINPRLIAEGAMATVTPSNTAVGAEEAITFTDGLRMASGQILKVAQSVYAGVQDKVQVLTTGETGDY